MLQRIDNWLTPRRLGYAWIAGGVLWLAWLLSILLGPGDIDLAGQVVGTDYLAFHAVGTTVRIGESGRLYDIDYQAQTQYRIIGPELTSYYGYLMPPFLTWLFVPFSMLPYRLAFALWSLLGLLGLWWSLVWLWGSASWRRFGWALTWFPIFASVSYGENSLLSLTILSLTYRLWRDERPWAAGLVCSLILYKPQLALGVGALWLLSGKGKRGWTALAGLVVGGMGLAALCFILMPEASWAYVDFALTVLPNLPAWQEFPLWQLHTVRGFWRLLLPGMWPLADGLALLISAVGLWGCVRLWRWQRTPKLRYATAICLTLWLTPHAMIYDWAVLLIPAVLFWQTLPARRDALRVWYALLWALTFLGGPLNYALWQQFGVAFQATVPVFLGGCVAIAYELKRQPPDFTLLDKNNPGS